MASRATVDRADRVTGWWIFAGGGFGRWMGIFAAALSAIGSLLSIDAYPFWSLSVFALSIIIIYQLASAPLNTSRA
jgi:hypothetical protein